MTNKHVIYWEQLCLVSVFHALCRLPAGSPIWASEAPRCPGKVSLPCRHISRCACTFHVIPQMESLLAGYTFWSIAKKTLLVDNFCLAGLEFVYKGSISCCVKKHVVWMHEKCLHVHWESCKKNYDWSKQTPREKTSLVKFFLRNHYNHRLCWNSLHYWCWF